MSGEEGAKGVRALATLAHCDTDFAQALSIHDKEDPLSNQTMDTGI